jgi:ketosteroid isomerase-like protein
MSVAANKEVVRGFVSAMQDGSRERLAETLTPDAVWWLPGNLPISGRYEGRDAILNDFLAKGMGIFQPGTLAFEVVNMVGEGDTVAVEWISDGISAAGAHYRNHYHFAFDIKAGRVHEVREYFDSLYAAQVLWPDGV